MLSKKSNAAIIVILVLFAIFGTFAYIYGLTQNPEYAGTWGSWWNDLWGDYELEENQNTYTQSDDKACSKDSDCIGNKICVSTRICLQGALDKKCDCFGTTAGACKEFIATGGYIKTCSLGGQQCANDQRTGKVYPLCCRGYSCNNGKCEGPSGRCPFYLNSD